MSTSKQAKKVRAFTVTNTKFKVAGIVFADSAGHAKMIYLMSAQDAGHKLSIIDIRACRSPSLDARIPSWYRNQCLSADALPHAQDDVQKS